MRTHYNARIKYKIFKKAQKIIRGFVWLPKIRLFSSITTATRWRLESMSSPGYLVLMFTLDTQTFKMYSLLQVATILYTL